MVQPWITADEMAFPSEPDAPFAAEAASWILYKLTGEKYPGVTTTTELYLHNSIDFSMTCWAQFGAVYAAGVDAGLSSLVRIPFAAMNDYRSLRMRGRPIRSVTSVKTGASGALLDPSKYRIANSAYLVRTDNISWNLYEGVEVTYSYGIMPPEAGKRAAAVLANELVKLITGDDSCRLPERVTSISRQGISLTVMDPNEFIKDDRVGLYEVDLFIRAANPTGSRKRPKVFSPDMPRGERWR